MSPKKTRNTVLTILNSSSNLVPLALILVSSPTIILGKELTIDYTISTISFTNIFYSLKPLKPLFSNDLSFITNINT